MTAAAAHPDRVKPHSRLGRFAAVPSARPRVQQTPTYQRWLAHDFELRLGKRDGWSFPCELDAWLISEADYYRRMPETPADTQRFAPGAPEFRLVTQVSFVSAAVELTRGAAADPVRARGKFCRRRLRATTGWTRAWNGCCGKTPAREEVVPMPGWRSTVIFQTPAAATS